MDAKLKDGGELLALALTYEGIEGFLCEGNCKNPGMCDGTEVTWCGRKAEAILKAIAATLPAQAPAGGVSREKLLALVDKIRAGIRYGEGFSRDECADFLARLAAKPAEDGVREALRRLAIVQCHQMAYGGATVHVGWTCKSCGSEWGRDDPEKHKPDCAAALSNSGEAS